MADDDVVLDDEPVDPSDPDEPVTPDDPDAPSEDEETEVEVLQDIRNDIRYFIKCTVPNSVYQDFEFPTSE